MVRHLRNAIGHGNRFRIDYPAKLIKFPAHTQDASPQPASARKLPFEITPVLHGEPSLFEYIEAWEVATLFQAVGRYLRRVADGLPGHGTSVEGALSARDQSQAP
jgi:hypothetical protein